jgi:hypothetical protein
MIKNLRPTFALGLIILMFVVVSCSKDKSEKNRRKPGEASGIVSLTFEGIDYNFNVETLYIENFVDPNPPSKRRIEGGADAGQYGVAFSFNVFETGSYTVTDDNIPLSLNILSKSPNGNFNFLFSTPDREIDPVSGAPFFPVFNLNITKWEGHQFREQTSKGPLFERLENFEATFEITYRVPQFDPNIEEYKSVTNGFMRLSLK